MLAVGFSVVFYRARDHFKFVELCTPRIDAESRNNEEVRDMYI